MLSGFLIRSVLAGALWSFLNILLLTRLAALLGTERPRRGRRLALLLAAKFGLLYPAGIWLLWSGAVHRMGFAVGFTAVLAIATVALTRTQSMKVSHV